MSPSLTLLAETAADLMNAEPVSMAATATIAEAAEFLTSRGYGAAVIIDDAGHPLGVVTKTDLLIHNRQHGSTLETDTTRVPSVMTPAVFSVQQDTPARSVVAQFLALNVHHLFVTDRDGVLIGIISPVDVLKKLG